MLNKKHDLKSEKKNKDKKKGFSRTKDRKPKRKRKY